MIRSCNSFNLRGFVVRAINYLMPCNTGLNSEHSADYICATAMFYVQQPCSTMSGYPLELICTSIIEDEDKIDILLSCYGHKIKSSHVHVFKI